MAALTKEAALYNFFNGFNIPAYPVTNVPDGAEFPYMTYEVYTAAFNEGETSCTVNLWYYTFSEAQPNLKADEIGRALGLGGVRVPCKDGFIWIKRGAPFCQALTDPTDKTIKRRYLNLSIEYITLI